MTLNGAGKNAALGGRFGSGSNCSQDSTMTALGDVMEGWYHHLVPHEVDRVYEL